VTPDSQEVRIEQVALFIDFENLVLGASASLLPGQDDPIPPAALELLCRDYGNATVRRAYADWAQQTFGRYQESLALNGIDLIQVARFGTVQKNAADIRMAVDAMETLFTHSAITTYMLVAGDGDYSPLVQRLREHGKRVVGVGTKASASKRLVAVCSEYKYWESLVAANIPEARPALDSRFDIADAERLLRMAMEESSTSAPVGSWLKSKMLALDPTFDERNYGSRGFGDFLARFPRLIEVHRPKGPGDIRVSLVPTARRTRKQPG
jgi:uncharacterized protein (TIGR00288 family)